MSVNTVSVPNNKREKKKPQGLFLLLAFNFWPPPPPPHSPYHHFPFSPIDPSSCIPPGCPETLHYCCHGSASIIWQWSRTLSPPPPPHVFLLSFQQLPLPPSCSLLKHGFRTKKNHQIAAASGPYDDGTTPPRGFSPLSQNPLNDCSNHNVLTLWSQVPIPLFFWLSGCLSIRLSLRLFLTCSSPDLNWQACGPGLPWKKDSVRAISEPNQPASN